MANLQARATGATPAAAPPTARADARRNRARLLAAADQVIAEQGAAASLEEIARVAGVGSATLHRHFASRQALLEAVFHDRVTVLCDHARRLLADADPSSALVEWLRAVAAYVATTRGMAASLTPPAAPDTPDESTCFAMLSDAGDRLLRRARSAGAVRPGVSIGDLLTLVNAISLVAEASGPAAVDRLLDLAIEGIRRH